MPGIGGTKGQPPVLVGTNSEEQFMIQSFPEDHTEDHLLPKPHFCTFFFALSSFLHSPAPENTPWINLLIYLFIDCLWLCFWGTQLRLQTMGHSYPQPEYCCPTTDHQAMPLFKSPHWLPITYDMMSRLLFLALGTIMCLHSTHPPSFSYFPDLHLSSGWMVSLLSHLHMSEQSPLSLFSCPLPSCILLAHCPVPPPKLTSPLSEYLCLLIGSS